MRQPAQGDLPGDTLIPSELFMLMGFIVLYLLASVAIGLYAARRVHNTADYAVAGRSLP